MRRNPFDCLLVGFRQAHKASEGTQRQLNPARMPWASIVFFIKGPDRYSTVLFHDYSLLVARQDYLKIS